MMRTYRGIVCEKKNKYTVFLTDKGDFLRGIPIGETPDIGDEVDFHPVFTPSLFAGKVKPRFVAAVMIAAVLLISIVASLIPINDKVMAYVQLETGTALELGVNHTGKVVALRYLNGTPSEQRNGLTDWKGEPIRKVLDTAVKELSVESHDMQVNMTIIYSESESQQKVQKIVGSAVREIQSSHKELALKIDESTAQERALANQNKMSVHKFRDSQQGSPMNEKQPSSQVDHDKETNSQNQDKDKDERQNSDVQLIPPAPSNQKNIDNEKNEVPQNHREPTPKKPDTKVNQEKDEKRGDSPTKKNSSNSIKGNGNSEKGNQNPGPKQPKESQNLQKQPGATNGHGKQSQPPHGNDRK